MLDGEQIFEVDSDLSEIQKADKVVRYLLKRIGLTIVVELLFVIKHLKRLIK